MSCSSLSSPLTQSGSSYLVSYCAFFLIFLFYGGWQPALRCISTTYYDKAKMERHGNDLNHIIIWVLSIFNFYCQHWYVLTPLILTCSATYLHFCPEELCNVLRCLVLLQSPRSLHYCGWHCSPWWWTASHPAHQQSPTHIHQTKTIFTFNNQIRSRTALHWNSIFIY